ncbi:hypothetical protein KDJ57_gp44 [Gordonia phage Catfish]|uniref:Uncharacterized protein n=1 Tax=Gordonia phage Catfish TaxID=2301538 RepID=A0A385D1V5_9CAUD|nr:hypothetical protein KDJ57_gp44 [Gordonia phage Catfish]AXQ51901.1 hypothetical protein SEA_CATFISH_65 [Gordonia phage Catfish]
MKCVVAQWMDEALDDKDRAALPVLAEGSSMATFHREVIVGLYGNVFGLTSWKDHDRQRCVCHRR